jgi:hypothetical protein
VKVRHPNLNEPNVLDVDEKALDSYLAAGWVRVNPPRKKPAAPAADDTKE